MRLDLIELLSARPIAHPTRIERAIIRQDRLELLVSGWPWWREVADDAQEQQITLGFEGLSDGALSVCSTNHELLWDEALEDFSIRSLANVEWAQPDSCQIYCNGPLANATTIYSKLQTYLCEVGAFKETGDFLNQGQLLSRFVKLTSGRSYLLARGPDVICRLLCEELDKQAVPYNVPYNVIVHRCPAEDRLWVSLRACLSGPPPPAPIFS
jgi:hypothetical protein